MENVKILMVGSGGIGCELLKNLVLAGYRDITAVDLDTIELSNLNRQFLFRKKDINRSKSIVAREAVMKFAPSDSKIKAFHGDIKNFDTFDLNFFEKFDIIMNALDNLEARKYVNTICLILNIPLIESGTAGYLGQVSCIIPKVTECFECQPKATPITYPVCTIRNSPTQMIHCIVWAKDFLFKKLFCAELEDEEQENYNALSTIENAKELIDRVFVKDIEKLLLLSDLWTNRTPPIPLDKTEITMESFSESILESQRILNIKENLELFANSFDALKKRNTKLEFDKNDLEIMNFISSASNIRSLIFSIPMESTFKIKEMAGNIIPAIATTNAVIAGLMILKSFNILAKKYEKCKTSFLTFGQSRNRLIISENIVPPAQECSRCNIRYIRMELDENIVLHQFITNLFKTIGKDQETEEFSISESARLLFDLDFTDNLNKACHCLGFTPGKFVKVEFENEAIIVILEKIRVAKRKLEETEFI